MNPIGQYIKINQPEPVNKYCFLTEKEPIIKAEVENISPDSSVPFSTNSIVYFYTGKQVVNKYGIFVALDFIVGYNLKT